MANFENIAALKKAQKVVADASVALGSAIAEADAKLSRPAAGPGRNAYDALMSMKRTQDSWFITAREFVTTGAIEGVPATTEQVQKLLKLGSKLANDYAVGVTTVSQYTVSNIAVNALASVAGRLFNVGNQLAEGAGAIVGGAATLMKWLPAILVAIVVGPLVLKTFSGYKSGGARGAADAAAGELSRARSALARKAKLSGMKRRRSR
jgi:hypothetical protein